MKEKKPNRAKLYSYPGWLGKPADVALLNRAAVTASFKFTREHPHGTERQWKGAVRDAIEGARLNHRYEVGQALLAHFRIEPSHADAYLTLALRLMDAHVPASQFAEPVRRGRPSSHVLTLAEAIEKMGGKSHRKKPGAPRLWEVREYRKLLLQLAAGKDLLRQQRQKVTNEGALIALYLHWRKFGGKSWTPSEAREKARAAARRISDANRAIRKADSLRESN